MSAPTTGSPNMDVTVVSKEMALLSNLLAAYTFIAGTPKLKLAMCHSIDNLVHKKNYF